jgi:hypothetical protein
MNLDRLDATYRRLRYEVGLTVDRFPPAYVFWRYLRSRSGSLSDDYLVNDETDLVIEGFPRSANSFAYAAFCFAQTERLHVAHHTHRPSQVWSAVKRRLPTLVLIRQPVDAVISFIIFRPYLTLKQGLRGYIDFYRRIAPFRSGYVLADFAEVTDDFGEVMRAVNVRFGSAFAPFEHTKENVEKVFAQVEREGRLFHGSHSELRVARPSEDRSEFKARLASELTTRRLSSYLSAAEDLYAQYRSWAFKEVK